MWEVIKSWRKTKETDDLLLTSRTSLPDGSPMHAHATQSRTFSVNFKDLRISCDGEADEELAVSPETQETPLAACSTPRALKLRRFERNKLIIIMVGLPGRGKTFLCNKLVCYLNWLGHSTKLFNVGSYRRSQKDTNEVQDAEFFDKNNVHGLEARRRALEAALEDLELYLLSDTGQVAIFDATNTTNDRRQQLIDRFHGRFQYLFIESICTDTQVLEENYRAKMRYSPDYRGVDEDKALADFKERIRKYEEVYEPLTDRTRHYIKLIDMVTGRGHMDINRISGYIPGKIVFFLMQVCKAGMNQKRKIWLTRHGESQFNQQGKIGGDSGLSETGQEYARRLPGVLIERFPLTDEEGSFPMSVWTSTLRRTIATADYLPFPKLRWKALDEIAAGSCDGLTYQEIHERFPEEFEARTKDKLHYRYPAGESYLDVIQRLEPVIIELEREKECVAIVGHQAVLRAVLGYFSAAPLAEIPTLNVPLHTLIELQPRPDGTMQVEHYAVMVDTNGRLSIPLPSDLLAKSSESGLSPQPSTGNTPRGASPGGDPAAAAAGRGTAQQLPSWGATGSGSSGAGPSRLANVASGLLAAGPFSAPEQAPPALHTSELSDHPLSAVMEGGSVVASSDSMSRMPTLWPGAGTSRAASTSRLASMSGLSPPVVGTPVGGLAGSYMPDRIVAGAQDTPPESSHGDPPHPADVIPDAGPDDDLAFLRGGDL